MFLYNSYDNMLRSYVNSAQLHRGEDNVVYNHFPNAVSATAKTRFFVARHRRATTEASFMGVSFLVPIDRTHVAIQLLSAR